MDADFFKPFVDGALLVLRVQTAVEAKHKKPFIKGTSPQPKFGLGAFIELNGNKQFGTVCLYFPEKVYLEIMGRMLGETPKTLTADIMDGAGEMMNIIYGQAKTVLNERGHNLQKALPKIIRADEMELFDRMKASSMDKVIVLPFELPFGEVHLEIGIKSVV